MVGKIKLPEGSSKKLQLEIKDEAFQISVAELARLEEQAKLYYEQLRGTNFEAQGLVLKNDTDLRLDTIYEKQKSAVKPEDKVFAYRENIKLLEIVKSNVDQMARLVNQVSEGRGTRGFIGGLQTFATWGIVVAIVFGVSILAFTIFKLWQHQMAMMMAMAGVKRGQIEKYGLRPFALERKRKKKKAVIRDIRSEAEEKPSIISVSIFRLIALWRAVAEFISTHRSIFIILGVSLLVATIIFFVFGLTKPRTIKFGRTPPQIEQGVEQAPVIIEEPAATKKIKNEGTMTETPLSLPSLEILPTGLGWLRVREEASLQSKEIGRVNVGERFIYTETKDNWYKIILPEGTEGWIFGKYVKIINEE